MLCEPVERMSEVIDELVGVCVNISSIERGEQLFSAASKLMHYVDVNIVYRNTSMKHEHISFENV